PPGARTDELALELVEVGPVVRGRLGAEGSAPKVARLVAGAQRREVSREEVGRRVRAGEVLEPAAEVTVLHVLPDGFDLLVGERVGVDRGREELPGPEHREVALERGRAAVP